MKSAYYSKDTVLWLQAEHAAAAGCRVNTAFCYDLLEAVRQSLALGLDRPVFMTDIDAACTVRKYADACLWRGVDVQAQDPQRAAHYLALGCSTDVDEYTYKFPELPPHSSFQQTWPNTPSRCCGRLISLYSDHVLEPPSRDFMRGLRAREDELMAAEHQQSQEEQARDDAEDAEKSRQFTEDLNKLSTLDEVAAGLAAVNQGIAAQGATQSAQANTPTATHSPTTAMPTAPSTNQGAASATAVDPATARAAAIATHDQQTLAACLSTDRNCEYGTSSNCQPSVAYGDAWGERGSVKIQIINFNLCSGDWSTVCWPRMKSALPNMTALGARMATLQQRLEKDPTEVQSACPASLDNQKVSQVPFWCGNRKEDCLQSLQGAFDALEEARKVDACLYSAEFQHTANQRTAEHDAECHRKLRAQ